MDAHCPTSGSIEYIVNRLLIVVKSHAVSSQGLRALRFCWGSGTAPLHPSQEALLRGADRSASRARDRADAGMAFIVQAFVAFHFAFDAHGKIGDFGRCAEDERLDDFAGIPNVL